MELVLTQTSSLWASVKRWAKRTMIAFIKARQEEANRRIALMHLHSMTDRELNDIGIGRGDIRRVIYDRQD